MTLKALAAAAAVALVSATSGTAAPVNFDFSFTDGTNTITGLIEGLDSDADNQQASSVTVSGLLGNYTYPSSSSTVNTNNFNVSGSVIDWQVSSFYGEALAGAPIDNILSFGNLLFLLYEYEDTFPDDDPPVWTTASHIEIATVSAVPLPAGGLLLLTGLAGVAGLKRRKKRAA